MDPPLAPGARRWTVAPASTLVYGPDETATAALAAALALREHGTFRWVDCARAAPEEGLPAHDIFARGSPRPEVSRVDARLLRSAAFSPSALHELVVLEGTDQERRLRTFLGLPQLFQLLGGPGPDDGGSAVGLLANVDHLPSEPGGRLLEQRSFHRTLHDAGVVLFSTTAGSPSPALVEAFDRLYRIELPPDAGREAGVVWEEKTVAPGTLPRVRSVREAWAEWQLDPTLLP
jgi:hypothetical protein